MRMRRSVITCSPTAPKLPTKNPGRRDAAWSMRSIVASGRLQVSSSAFLAVRRGAGTMQAARLTAMGAETE